MDKSTCRYDAPMRTLLEAINNEPIGTAFVVDDDGRLCGIVTDGDFRRMLLAGRSLDKPLSKADLGTDYVYALQGEKFEDILKKTDRKVRVIPIVDQNHRPVDYFRYEHSVKMMPVAEPSLVGNEFKYLSDAFLSTWISSVGAYITRFENDFASYCEVKHGVAVSNGTVAIHLALVALGVGPGDEVIVPNLTFAATINTVLHAGATPVIVDVEEDSWCIDPAEIEKAITPRTKAIIPVHVYGQPCDMDRIMDIAKRHKLYVVEDAAEAHGASYKGKKVGSFGDISTFSFFGNKIVTTGEGGMCITNSDALNERMRVLRDHGMSKQKRYWHDVVGYNYRMTNLQAAIGCAQLERIGQIIADRAAIEAGYVEHLKDFEGLQWQKNFSDRQRVTWLVSLTVWGMDRDTLLDSLRNHGVDIRPFFYPLSTMPVYKPYVFSEKNSLDLAARGFNLPTIAHVDYQKVVRAFEAVIVTG